MDATPGTKVCPRCHIKKAMNKFYPNPLEPDGLAFYCKWCESILKKLRYYLKTGTHRQHRPPVHIRFWSKVNTSDGLDACWLWEGHCDDGGYGLSKHTDGGKTKKAHRIAWELTFGDIPPGMNVLHRCNNPGCVNVFKHLYLGTQADNMRQASEERRMKGGRSPDNPPQMLAVRIYHRKSKHAVTWEERFWAKVDRSGGPDACWLWTGTLSDGYGKFRLPGGVGRAHCIAYELEHGSILPSLQCMHTCDQRACCNPRHLCLGSKDDNFRDMIRKCRHSRTLTPEQALYAYAQKGIKSQSAVAKELGVTRSAISQLWNGRTWQHLVH